MADDRVARDLHGRLHHNVNHNRLGSECRDTTVLADCLGGDSVAANLVEVDRKGSLVLTRNLNTVLVPNVSIGIAVSIESDLAAFANRIAVGQNRNLSRNRMNRDIDGTRHRATSVRTSRGGGNRVGVVSHRRSSGNRGTGRGHETLTSPSVGNVVVRETSQVSVQHNHFAFANFHLVSIHLQVGTVGIDIEGLRGGTSTVGSGHRVSTSRGRGEGSSGSTVAPSVGISVSRVGSSVDRSRSAVADNVVARQREVRSSMHLNLGGRKRT